MKCLFFVEQNYAFAILRPLQTEILLRGYSVYWLLVGREVNRSYLLEQEDQFRSVSDVIQWNPDVIFVPGNMIPNFIPGIKVSISYGFNIAKANRSDSRGHFNIRECFDLFCTQMP